jgi:hypothetical protein
MKLDQYSTLTPPLSKWKCYLFGGRENGIVFQPLLGKEPNWVWRKMQHLAFGHLWIKETVIGEKK